MDRSSLAIIIPAYNEGVTIVSIVQEVIAFGMPIVVDDGSTDKTACLALDAGAARPLHCQATSQEPIWRAAL